MMVMYFEGGIFDERYNPVSLYIGQPTTSGLYSLPRDSHISGVVCLRTPVLWLGCAFRPDRLIHTCR